MAGPPQMGAPFRCTLAGAAHADRQDGTADPERQETDTQAGRAGQGDDGPCADARLPFNLTPLCCSCALLVSPFPARLLPVHFPCAFSFPFGTGYGSPGQKKDLIRHDRWCPLRLIPALWGGT